MLQWTSSFAIDMNLPCEFQYCAIHYYRILYHRYISPEKGLGSVFSSEVISDTFANRTWSWDEDAEPFRRTWCTWKPWECACRCGRSCVSTFIGLNLWLPFQRVFRILCHSCASEYRPRLENFISTQHVKKKPAAKQFWPAQCWNLQWILQNLTCQGHETTILARYRRVVTCGQKKNDPLPPSLQGWPSTQRWFVSHTLQQIRGYLTAKICSDLPTIFIYFIVYVNIM